MDDGKRTKDLVAAKAPPVGETDATAEELPRLDRESPDFLPFLVDSLPVLVSFVDAQGRYRFINKTYEDWFGHSRAEVIGQSVRRFLGEEAYRVVEDKVAAALSGQEVRYESQIPFRDGGRRHVDAYYVPQFDAEGNVLGFFSLVTDITERKRAEERLEHVSLVLRAIRNVNQLLSREKDRGRLLQGACDNLVQTRGYLNAWIALLDDSRNLLTTAEAGLGEDFLPMIERLKRGGVPQCGRMALDQSEVVAVEDPSSTCTDCPLAGEYTNRAAMTVRLEHEGRVYGVLTASIPRALVGDEEENSLFHELADDIAFALRGIELEEERKRAEEERQRLLHETSERAKELGCMYGVTESVRKRETLEEIFRDVAALLPPGWQYPEITRARVRFDGGDYVSQPFEETDWRQSSDIVVNGERRGIVEVYYLEERPELEEGPFMTGERRLIDGVAHVLGEAIERRCAEEAARQSQEELLAHQRDEQQRMEAELEKIRAELVRKTRLAAIGQVSASIAHDLRNPLGAARNAAFYLKRHVPKDEPELAEFLQIIEDEVDNADRIIGSLLALTRSDPVSKQTVDLRELVEEAFSRITDTDGVRCRVSTDPDPFPIRAAPDQFRQVLINLGKNAVQAMEGKGELSIEASRSATCDVIIVRDTGPGISGDVREKLFEPLVTTKAKGTGLGLTICRQIVDRHGGTIELMEDESSGAAFQISLPREGQSVDAE